VGHVVPDYSLYLYRPKKAAEAQNDRYNSQFVSTIKPEDAFRPRERWGNPIAKT
jgi:hypothetical protein